MTQNLKIEVLTGDISIDGMVVTNLVTKEELSTAIVKKADLGADGKIPTSQLPAEIVNTAGVVDQVKTQLETSIKDAVDESNAYAESYTDNAVSSKADLASGKVPLEQLPAIDQYPLFGTALSNLSTSILTSVKQRTDELEKTKADLDEDGKVLREQIPSYEKISGLPEQLELMSTQTAAVSGELDEHKLQTADQIDTLKENINSNSEFLIETMDERLENYADKDAVKRGIANRYDPSLTYNSGERVILDNGDIVKSTIDGNTNDPNVDMTEWINPKAVQDEINNSTVRYTASVSDMLAIQNPFSGQVVITLSYVAGLNKGGAKYTYDAARAAENNGITCIDGWVKNNTSRLLASQAGCREGDFENTDQLNALILAASNEGIKEVILDGFYKIGKLEKGITTTPLGDENAWWLLKARSNVTVKGRSWSDGLLIAGGLVASNASEPNPKGYMVFGDYNQSDIENFKIKNFTIDNNGQENLLPAVVGFGAQALCPNVWFQRGKNIGVFDIHFKDNAGHQTVVLDSGVHGAKVVGNTFTDNGKGLPNNTNIVDHSTVYVRATDFLVTNNTFTFETLKPDISTALEIHGVNGHVYGNTTNGYPFPLIRASFFGQSSKNVKVHDNTFNECNYGLNLDGADNSPLYVDVYSNTFNFRAEKPANGKSQVAVGHTATGGFNAVTPTSTHDIIINVKNNVFKQPEPTGGWTKFNEFDNCMWDGGKCTEVNFENNTFNGFKGCYRINYANGKTRYSFNDTLINCGSQNTDFKSNVFIQNIDASWSGNIISILNSSKLEFCLYDSLVYFYNTIPPIYMNHTNESTNWILPYEGESPDNANLIVYDYSVRVVDPNKILWAQGIKVSGKITLPNDQYFYKQNGYVGRWNMHRTMPVLPTSPRFFGDIKGDTVTIINPNSGQPFGAVCTVSGADVNTVGTWKGYGVIQA